MHFRSEQPQPQQPGGDASSTQSGEEQSAAAAAAAAAEGPDHLAGLDLSRVPFPLRPIGVLRSCFSRRNGTPRQPLLVPAARAELVLRADLSGDYLEGLGQYTHCWVLYIFHENTNLRRLWQGGGGNGGTDGQPAKVRVPRLDGGRLGVFATRTPHRPCPVGLSVARVLSVEGRTLILGGADIVDGSPILDIKPYVPFCDALPDAGAPAWVSRAALRVWRCLPSQPPYVAWHSQHLLARQPRPSSLSRRWRRAQRRSPWRWAASRRAPAPRRSSARPGRRAGGGGCTATASRRSGVSWRRCCPATSAP